MSATKYKDLGTLSKQMNDKETEHIIDYEYYNEPKYWFYEEMAREEFFYITGVNGSFPCEKKSLLWFKGIDLFLGPIPKEVDPTECPPKNPQPGQEWTDPATSIKLCWIPAGNFIMGPSTMGDRRSCDILRRPITITTGFWMSKYQITQAEWAMLSTEFDSDNPLPSQFKGENNPVEMVSQNDCYTFLEKLNMSSNAGVYKLPTEYQWEYACRAGTTSSYYFGDEITSKQVNYKVYFLDHIGYESRDDFIVRDTTIPVGSFPPNAWGLHDMHGNVWEWCDGSYGYEKPLCESLRGGSWNTRVELTSSFARMGATSDTHSSDIGFRVVLVSKPSKFVVDAFDEFALAIIRAKQLALEFVEYIDIEPDYRQHVWFLYGSEKIWNSVIKNKSDPNSWEDSWEDEDY